jgi:hypothetical protein
MPINRDSFRSLQVRLGGLQLSVWPLDCLAGEELKRRAVQMFTQQPQAFRDIIAATQPEVMLEHDICYRPSWKSPEGALGEGPLTLAGDTAHALRPTGR